jgi:hypothetical protein
MENWDYLKVFEREETGQKLPEYGGIQKEIYTFLLKSKDL